MDIQTLKSHTDAALVERTTPGYSIPGVEDRMQLHQELARRARSVEATERVRWAYLFTLLEAILQEQRQVPSASSIANAIRQPD